jgi:hypothetical protein
MALQDTFNAGQISTPWQSRPTGALLQKTDNTRPVGAGLRTAINGISITTANDRAPQVAYYENISRPNRLLQIPPPPTDYPLIHINTFCIDFL